MERQVGSVCGPILDALLKYIKPASEEEIEKISMLKKQLKLGRAYISRVSSTKSIVEMLRIQYADSDIDALINTNPDILVAKNGVIDLRDGTLRDGSAKDWMNLRLEVKYKGRGSSTEDIDLFMNDIFANNTELIEYVQRLLGYGITGHHTERCFVIFTGDGSNGKSLLIEIIAKLLNKWFIAASGDIFFKSSKRAQNGGPTPHLAALKGARICVKDEADPDGKFNIEMIKEITGRSLISARALHAKFENFRPTALPILLCNHMPTFDVDDDALRDRMKVIPFSKIYTIYDDPNRPYDANNPRHGLRDSKKYEKLLTECSQEQLLIWLVHGAVKWYANGLGETPQCMKDALKEYRAENDTLKTFIEEYCEISPDYKVNAGAFRDAYKRFIGYNVQQTVLVKMMKKRKYEHVQARVGESKSVQKIYKGLQLVPSYR
ncbi:hypothetical protein BGZ79_002589 [Entomortierella chlamydospora]|nr:hypothetical protein BGZ79_002589 [Entomortierella chlamydospora]